ncbi:hypothetical protein [Nostoc linckia]|uniref:hypothetical protein n=1 Tax=Nostoc linckia TaxID=92942 RepID=UPI000BFFC5B6|nr:hypothetical protein [Nostoc linckia]PHJ93838.1 hypothetical protein VF09_37245 [Nostoc linckia z9]
MPPEISPETSRTLRVLVALSDLTQVTTAAAVSVDQVTEHLDADDVGREAVEHHLELLRQRGLVRGFRSIAGLQGVWLQPAGRAKAEEFDRLRRDPVLRRQGLQDRYLQWLYDETEVRGGAPDPDAFLATEPNFHGVLFTPVELERAGALLEEAGFIEGPSVDQYAAPLRPRPTAKGRKLVEMGGSVHDPAPAAVQHFSTTVHGNARDARQILIRDRRVHAPRATEHCHAPHLQLVPRARLFRRCDRHTLP